MLSMINTYKYNILDLSSLNIFLWCVYLYVLNTLHHITGKKISTHPKAELKQALVLCETSCVTLERFDLWISRSELRDGWSDTFQMCSPTHVACSWGCDEFVLWVHKCHPFAQILAIWGLSYSAISSINLFIYIWHGVEIMYVSKVSVVVEGQAARIPQTTRHAICAMLKHPNVTDAFLFPLQSMFFDSLRMDRLSTAVWIDEDRCCTVVHFFLPAIWTFCCHRRYGPAPSIITCNAALGAVGRGKRWVGSSAFWRKGGFKSLSQTWLLNLIFPKSVPQVVSRGLRICRSSYFETCVGCWLSGELRYHTGIMDNTLHQFQRGKGSQKLAT